MLRRLRRPTAALAAALLLCTVAACGSDSKDSKSSKDSKAGTSSTSGLKSVSFSGGVGTALTAKWTSKITVPKSTEVSTIVKGTGDKIASGDKVSTYLWVGNGTTKKEAFSDYKNGAAESIPNDDQLPALFKKLLAGASYGSRVAAVTTPTELFGSAGGNPQLGIGAKDTVVIVADFVKKAEVSPTPSDDQVHKAKPGAMPKVVSTAGNPTGLDWTGVTEPDLTTPVQRIVLKKGTGAPVKATDTVTVNYLGETYKATTPFDESYSKGTPLTQPLSGLIKGWSIGLTGVKIGSRVLLQIPPAFGYDAAGGGDAIPGNATLWFVIDVVSVS